MDTKNNKKTNDLKTGDIVYLTRHYAEWIKQLKGDLNIAVVHRIAKIVKIFDWKTTEGKLLLEQRRATGKWKNLEIKDFKYVLNVYFPELEDKKTKQVGMSLIEVLPLNYPSSTFQLFEKYPEHLITDLNEKEIKDIFKIEKK